MKNLPTKEYDLNKIFREDENEINIDDIVYDKEMSIEELEEVASKLEDIRIEVDADQIEEIDKKLDEIDDLIVQKSIDTAEISDKDVDDFFGDEGNSESDFDKWVNKNIEDETFEDDLSIDDEDDDKDIEIEDEEKIDKDEDETLELDDNKEIEDEEDKKKEDEEE